MWLRAAGRRTVFVYPVPLLSFVQYFPVGRALCACMCHVVGECAGATQCGLGRSWQRVCHLLVQFRMLITVTRLVLAPSVG